jgi:hypothetical protein
MHVVRRVVAVLLLVGGCSSKSSGIAPGPTDSADVHSGTPESMLADASAGANGGGAADSAPAYVQGTFDSHAATVVRRALQASCG